MRNLVLDMTGIPFMSSSGIVALHTISLLLRDERLPELKNGWAALRGVANENSGLQQHVKLVNPQLRIYQTLDITGMKNFFEIYNDLALAVASF
jgi:anti-anti-sigma regulatory factor